MARCLPRFGRVKGFVDDSPVKPFHKPQLQSPPPSSFAPVIRDFAVKPGANYTTTTTSQPLPRQRRNRASQLPESGTTLHVSKIFNGHLHDAMGTDTIQRTESATSLATVIVQRSDEDEPKQPKAMRRTLRRVSTRGDLRIASQFGSKRLKAELEEYINSDAEDDVPMV